MGKYKKLALLIPLTLLISIELPYRSYSIAQFILPAIYSKTSGSALHLSGFLAIILIIVIIKEIKKLKPKVSTFWMTIAILFFAFPYTLNVGDDLVTNIYRSNVGADAIEVTDNWIYISMDSDKIIIDLGLDLIAYDEDVEPYHLSMQMPIELQEIYGNENIVIEEELNILEGPQISFAKQIELTPVEGKSNMDIDQIKKSFRNYQIYFQKENEKAKWYLTKF